MQKQSNDETGQQYPLAQTDNHGKWLLIGYAFLLAMWAAVAAQAQVVANPPAVTFDSKDQSITIQLSANGQPISAKDIRGYELYVGENTYAQMLQFSKSDGAVTIKPTELLEIGEYDLIISTKSGPARVKLNSPLMKMPTSHESLAAAQGVTVEQLLAQMGVGPQAIRQMVTIELAPSYHVGNTLNLSLQDSPASSNLFWRVNGQEVAQGGTLDYPFQAEGPHTVELAVRGTDGQVKTIHTVSTSVSAGPSKDVNVKPNTRLTLQGQPGFGAYAWTIDGQPAGNGASLEHRFTQPGVHTVQVRQSQPQSGPASSFSVLTYRVNVAR